MDYARLLEVLSKEVDRRSAEAEHLGRLLLGDRNNIPSQAIPRAQKPGAKSWPGGMRRVAARRLTGIGNSPGASLEPHHCEPKHRENQMPKSRLPCPAQEPRPEPGRGDA